MRLFSLVLVNLGRNKLRTVLTTGSVLIALFLFCALRGVLDTFADAIKVGSEQRVIVRNKISLVFPLPLSYLDRIRVVDGVKSVSWSNWFGAIDPANERDFFAQFGVDAATYLPMYANDITIVQGTAAPGGAEAVPAGADPKLGAFFSEQTACLVGEKLLVRKHWKLGQTVTLRGTIYPGNWPFTIRAVYRAKNPAINEDTMFFHWKYLYERSNHEAMVGVYNVALADPEAAGRVSRAIDALFENSSAATHTETERAFQAGFISMYGNIPFLLRVIGMAIAFAILLVAANTMMMATRERTGEYAVLKTLGFEDGTIFRLVLAEAAVITLGGGIAGSLLARLALQGVALQVIPPMQVHWSTVVTGTGLAVAMGAASGLLPAWQASRLKIVDALRRSQ